MNRRITKIVGAMAAAALLLAVIFLIRPLNEIALIRQVSGADFSQPYLGRTYLIPTGRTLRQYFTPPRPGNVSSIGVFTPRPNRDARGSVVFKLVKIDGRGETTLYTSTSNIANLANNEGLSIWRFQPVKVKKGERLAVSLTAKAKPGLLVFGKKNTYEGGYATVDKTRLGIDIDFEVFYSLTWGRLWRHLDKDAPNLAGPPALSFMLILLWLALALWLHQLFYICFPTKGPSMAEAGR